MKNKKEATVRQHFHPSQTPYLPFSQMENHKPHTQIEIPKIAQPIQLKKPSNLQESKRREE